MRYASPYRCRRAGIPSVSRTLEKAPSAPTTNLAEMVSDLFSHSASTPTTRLPSRKSPLNWTPYRSAPGARNSSACKMVWCTTFGNVTIARLYGGGNMS